jgi:hypothetical protein
MTSTPLGNAIVTQVAIVVRDIEQAVGAWSALLNVSRPNIITTDTVESAHTQYLGDPTPARARLAFFSLGQVTLELIEPLGEPSTWNDQLVQHGQCLHHIAFQIKGMQTRVDELAEHGMRLIQRGDYTGGRYAYVDGQERFGAVIELLEND